MTSPTGDAKPSIEVSKNGPYLVSDVDALQNSRGEAIPTKPVIALCRCGGSAKKPFCDGTHARIGFSGEKLTDGSQNKRVDYGGAKITIHDNRGICAHAGHCTDQLSSVFSLEAEPWTNPDSAAVEAIIETIKKCPSGALSYSIEGVEHEERDRPPMMTVSKDGPYEVIGGPELRDEEGRRLEAGEHCTLCRCGGSKNKPRCDVTHWDINFQDAKN